MIPELTPIERCAEMAGLRSHEIVLGVSPGDKHYRMFARYRRAVSLDAARTRVVADIRNAVEIGAARRAADLLIVLRWLLAPGASCDTSRMMARPRRRVSAPRRRLGWRAHGSAAQPGVREGDVVALFDSARGPAGG